MKIRISPFVLLRIPRFPINATLEQSWTKLTEAIGRSSPAFHEIIAALDVSDIGNADRKTKYTLWKYFNRAKYRGIPYGKFAGFGIASLSHKNGQKQRVRISTEQYTHSFPDWNLNNIVDKSDNAIFIADRMIVANSTTYTLGSHIRYINVVEGGFELAEISRDDNIEAILMHCIVPLNYNDLIQPLSQHMELGDLNLLIKEMLEIGLLFTDLQPNIIGVDFFERLRIMLPEGVKTYDLAERKVLEGNIDAALLKSLPSCIEFLKSVTLPQGNNAFLEFKAAFSLKYEKQEVPLLLVLDPEIGLGYHQLETSSDTDDLISMLSARRQTIDLPNNVAYDQKFNTFLLNAMQEVSGDREAVINLRNFKPAPSISRLANSFTILAHLSGKLIIPDFISGCTANAITGRFTLANDEILSQCKSTAKFESDSNPNILFFDIGYTAEGSVDNINRRKSIYDYELMMLSYAEGSTLIPMNDLYLTIKNDELILFSKTHQKRMVPRLASAYNYGRSDLSLFRFLCDLQHQGIQSQLTFVVQKVFPDLNFYPRIQYDEIVVSPAQWRIFVNRPIIEQLENNDVCQHFIAGTTDQKLRFNRHDPEDLEAFMQFSRQTDDFYIYEAFASDDHFIVDEQNNAYEAQVQLTAVNDEQIYEPYVPITQKLRVNKVERIIPQGHDWLYFELYCHPARANLLLTDQVVKFLDDNTAALQRFFFIRYNHPKAHLRIRFQLRDSRQGYLFIEQFTLLFKEALDAGIVTDIQIRPYVRELDRYGEERILAVESFFELSSKIILNILGQGFGEDEKYEHCISFAKALLQELKLGKNEQQKLIKESQDAFLRENQFSNAELKLINKAYADRLQNALDPEISNIDLSTLQKAFCELIESAEEQQGITLFRDLIHMHINRMFSDEQRLHELVLYSFLFKDMVRNLHRPHKMLTD